MIFVIFTCELHLTCILYVVVEISLSFSFLFYTCCNYFFFFFFFQAEDGIRDLTVTGVHKCAIPISAVAIRPAPRRRPVPAAGDPRSGSRAGASTGSRWRTPR